MSSTCWRRRRFSRGGWTASIRSTSRAARPARRPPLPGWAARVIPPPLRPPPMSAISSVERRFVLLRRLIQIHGVEAVVAGEKDAAAGDDGRAADLALALELPAHPA